MTEHEPGQRREDIDRPRRETVGPPLGAGREKPAEPEAKPEVGPGERRRSLPKVLEQVKSPRNLRPLLGYLTEIKGLEAQQREAELRELLTTKPEIYARLVTEVAKNVSKALPYQDHPHAWVYESIRAGAKEIDQPMKSFVEGELAWKEYALRLHQCFRAQSGSEGRTAKPKRADTLRFVAEALTVAASYRDRPVFAEALLGILAAVLPDKSALRALDSEWATDKDRLTDAVFELCSFEKGALSALDFILPLWSEVQRGKEKSQELQDTLERTQLRLSEVEAIRKNLEQLLTEKQACIRRLENEKENLLRQLKEAKESYEFLRKASERTRKEQLGGLISYIKRNLQHDLSEIEMALEGHKNEEDVMYALRRVAIIREYIDKLEVK